MRLWGLGLGIYVDTEKIIDHLWELPHTFWVTFNNDKTVHMQTEL